MSILKQVLFNDGEGVDFTDFNNLQRYMNAAVTDGVVYPAMADAFTGENLIPQANAVYARGTHAQPAVGSGLHVSNMAGPIHITTNGFYTTPTGNDTDILTYWLAQDELSTLLGTADPLLPRWDLLCIKLDNADGVPTLRDFQDATTLVKSTTTPNKQHAPAISKQIVTGTPNINPVEPAVPAGFSKYAAYLVGAATSTLNATTGMRDYRLPLGFYHYVARTSTMIFESGTWTPSAFYSQVGSGSGSVLVLPNGMRPTQRLMRITITGQFNAGTSVTLVRLDGSFSSTRSPLKDLSSFFASLGGTASVTLDTEAWWAGGYQSINAAQTDVIGIEIGTTGSEKIYSVQFNFAGGW